MAKNDTDTELGAAKARIDELERAISSLRHDIRGHLSPALLHVDKLRKHEDPKVARAAQVVVTSSDMIVKRLQETREIVPSRKQARKAPPTTSSR